MDTASTVTCLPVCQLFSALRFAADKHRHQRRKDEEASPYINHPIQVAELLWRVGQCRDAVLLTAAILHDVLEDTDATEEELEAEFGTEICLLVLEVTDDRRLSRLDRKRIQVAMAPHRSPRAKMLKLADKTCNIHDLGEHPPAKWDLRRRQDYLLWTAEVVGGLLGVNPPLEEEYLRCYAHTARMLELDPHPAFLDSHPAS